MSNYEKLVLDKADNLTTAEFKEKYLDEKKPVIISNSIHWDALKKWDPSYFKNNCPEKEVILAIFNPQINMPGTEIKTTLINAIDLICNNHDQNKKYYLMQRSIYTDFPELVSDIDMPKYSDRSKEHLVNLWFGEANTNTKPHYDYSHNFLTQIMGRKRVRLFAPDDTPNMYPYSVEYSVTMEGVHHPAVHASQIADIDNINNDKFPDFKKVTAFEGILYPGDLLFIPAGWWHEVRALDIAMSVNFWWKIKLEDFPPKQFTDVTCSYFCWYKELFHEKIRLAFDFSEFKNDLEIAGFLLNKKLKAVSALFVLSYIQQLFINKNSNMFLDEIPKWKNYLEIGAKGDNSLIQSEKLINIIEKIKNNNRYESIHKNEVAMNLIEKNDR